MGIFGLTIIALSLAVDCFAVSVCLGAGNKGKKLPLALKAGLLFGFFQAGMAYIGYLFGTVLLGFFKPYAYFLAFIILLIVGIKMIAGSIRTKEKCQPKTKFLLLILAVATSIDALTVGVSFGFIDIYFFYTFFIIGFFSLILSFIGVQLGAKIGILVGKRAELLAGIVLIVIGFRIII